MAQHAKKAPPSRQSVAYDYARVLPRQEEQNQPMQVHKGKARGQCPMANTPPSSVWYLQHCWSLFLTI